MTKKEMIDLVFENLDPDEIKLITTNSKFVQITLDFTQESLIDVMKLFQINLGINPTSEIIPPDEDDTYIIHFYDSIIIHDSIQLMITMIIHE